MAAEDPYILVAPPHFPDPVYTFDNNPVTKEGFALGRALFYDPLLSRDGSVSCNNCHLQATAFADSQQHPVSVGVDNRTGIRNAPPLMNLAFMKAFFWDGGVTHLDFVPLNAIESHFEMDETLANVVRKLNSSEHYPEMFQKAFGIDTITAPYMLHALSQFLVMMVSASSRYDQYVTGDKQALTAMERAGMEVFRARCSGCHSGELFSDFSYRNNGLSGEFPDPGRKGITESPADIGKFRVPSLRNIAKTAPYMHNAQFASLEEVLDHYESGVIDSETLDPQLRHNEQTGIPLTEAEKIKIIAFLKTLTDQEFITDPKFQNTPK